MTEGAAPRAKAWIETGVGAQRAVPLQCRPVVPDRGLIPRRATACTRRLFGSIGSPLLVAGQSHLDCFLKYKRDFFISPVMDGRRGRAGRAW